MGTLDLRPHSVAGYDFEYTKKRVYVWRGGSIILAIKAKGNQNQVDAVYDFLDRVVA